MNLRTIRKIKIFIVLLLCAVFVSGILLTDTKTGVVIVHAQDGAAIYASTCARCHGADGRAQTPKGKQTGATDFTSAKWQPNEARGIRTITNGRGKMPSFKSTLSAEEIRAAWNYVRRFK